MMKSLTLRSVVCLIFLSIRIPSSASGQSIDEIRLDAPEGWRKERFALPPSFAPTMKFQGQEELRFAPGMFRAESEDFFSYAFVFRLKNETLPGNKQLNEQLLVYFQGLAKAVSNGTVETDQFAIALKPVVKPLKGKAFQEAVGRLTWTEPFVTKTAQSLRIETLSWTHEKQHWVFLCVSPQKPEHEIWKSLHQIRDSFLEKQTP